MSAGELFLTVVINADAQMSPGEVAQAALNAERRMSDNQANDRHEVAHEASVPTTLPRFMQLLAEAVLVDDYIAVATRNREGDETPEPLLAIIGPSTGLGGLLKHLVDGSEP